MTSTKAPTLTDAKGMGGVNAIDGFDYQLWDGLIRIPGWLANPAFEELIFEGLEDLEARFFAPHAPQHRLLERYQAKSGDLTPKGVHEVLESFERYEQAHPRTTRVHTLVTPRMPSTLSWLPRDTNRVRLARPFYAPFPSIVKASDDKLKTDLENEYGRSLGTLVADLVEFSERILPNRDAALLAFGLALNRAFPHLDAGPKKIETAFEALSDLARRSIGAPLRHKSLVESLEDAVGSQLFNVGDFPLYVRSDQNGTNETVLEIDANEFSGGNKPFPNTPDWTERLIHPLEETARWLTGRSINRVALSGSYRLTTAFVIGHCLRSATGFELDIPTRNDTWSTDDHPRSNEIYPAWEITVPAILSGDRLVISVGILRDPTANAIEHSGQLSNSILRAFLPTALTSSRDAQAGVARIKAAIDTAVGNLKPRSIALYLAGPAAFAVALGHRWNAFPATQLHEFIAAESRYVPTSVVS